MTDKVGGVHKVYLGLGSNLGDKQTNIQKAIQMIGERVGKVLRQSALIETEPWGFESENKFLNGAILVETELSPHELLKTTQQIERELGRKKKKSSLTVYLSKCLSKRQKSYTDRPIDIDILLYDDLTVDEPDLKIPHSLMYERDFVMIPLKTIKPR